MTNRDLLYTINTCGLSPGILSGSSDGAVSCRCNQETPRDIPDKDETHTFCSTYCGQCGSDHGVGTTDPAQAVN